MLRPQARGVDDVAVLGDELDDRLDLLLLVAEARSARGTVWLTICIEPPPTSFLNLTSEKSGSMPVVSQSIMKPMVPVGASTEAWALRQPLSAPISRHSCHWRWRP